MLRKRNITLYILCEVVAVLYCPIYGSSGTGNQDCRNSVQPAICMTEFQNKELKNIQCVLKYPSTEKIPMYNGGYYDY